MATVAACRAAVIELAERLSGADDHVKEHVVDRTLSCRVPDLDIVFWGRLLDGELVDITTDPQLPAQIRLTVRSDDLVDLVGGQLKFPHAWATGRIKLDASLRDLLKLRTMLTPRPH